MIKSYDFSHGVGQSAQGLARCDAEQGSAAAHLGPQSSQKGGRKVAERCHRIPEYSDSRAILWIPSVFLIKYCCSGQNFGYILAPSWVFLEAKSDVVVQAGYYVRFCVLFCSLVGPPASPLGALGALLGVSWRSFWGALGPFRVT